MKILVFGGHGFIGQHIVSELQGEAHEVFAVSRQDGVDLRQFDQVTTCLKKIMPEVIVNCASHGGSLHYVAKIAADIVDDNMRLILNLYRAVKEVVPQATIINPISNCSYPGNSSVQTENQYWDGPVHPSVWSFGNTRRMWVAISDCYQKQYGITTLNVVVPNAYGPGDALDSNRTHALSGLVMRMLLVQKNNASEFEIWGSGKPLREWIYVGDVARIVAKAVNMVPLPITLVNLGQNKAFSIQELAEMIKKEIGYDGKLVFNTGYPDGDPVKKMDDNLFKKTFTDFKFTDIEKGIADTVQYYKENLPL